MRRRRRGFALMAAIWLMVAITAVSLELSVMARGRRLSAANTLEESRAMYAASSGVEHARARLTRAIAEGGFGKTWNDPAALVDPWHAPSLGIPDSVPLSNRFWYRVETSDLGARLNVNKSSEEDLYRYFSGLSLDAGRASGLAQSIMDWRDADAFSRLAGAEREAYLRDGARVLPRNGPFASVEELRLVKGMSDELFDRIHHDLTVFGSGQVNVNAAPLSVLMSLPGMTAAAAQRIVDARAPGQRLQSFQQMLDLLPSVSRAPLERSMVSLLPRISFETREVQVDAVGWTSGSPVRVRETAVVARGGDVAFVIWRQRQ
jgi:general secretion pathway protein K